MNATPLHEIYAPVAAELERVERSLEQQITLIAEHHEKLTDRHTYVKAVIQHLSGMRGKMLRPALSNRPNHAAGSPSGGDGKLSVGSISPAIS